MNVKLTRDVPISQNKGSSKILESAVILTAFDIFGHFPEFRQLFFDSGACNTVFKAR